MTLVSVGPSPLSLELSFNIVAGLRGCYYDRLRNRLRQVVMEE
jgi:hypothetical protein